MNNIINNYQPDNRLFTYLLMGTIVFAVCCSLSIAQLMQ